MEDKVEVEYNDLYGKVAIDFPGHPYTFEDFATKIGIDVKKYSPIGFEFYHEGDITDKDVDFYIYVYCMEGNNLVKFEKLMPLVDFLNELHRIHLIAWNKGVDPTTRGEVTKKIDLDEVEELEEED